MKKLFKIFFILFSFIINYQFLYAQVNLEWAREYYYNYSDNKAKCVAVDNEGNSIVTGTVLGSGIDIVTLRYNSGGDLLWSRIYTNANQYNSDDGVSDLVVDEQRNIYITGYTANSVSANRNIVTIKYSPAGDSLWVKHYAGAANGNDEGKAIALDNSGNVYVTGYSTGAGTNADYITIKYDSLGNELWVNKYNYFTNNADISNAIDVDERGNVYVTGQSEYSYLTIKYDSNGNLKWDKRYNAGSSTDIGISLEADIYGNVYVTGTSHIYGGFNNEDFATIKYDSLGNILWSKRYNSNGIDNAVSLKVVYEFDFNFPSDVIVTGTSSNDYLTIKYDGHDGDSLWVKRYNGPSNSLEVVSALAADNSGNVYVTGYSYDNATKNDFVTIMYDGIYGDELWNQRYHTSGNTNEKATDIALGPDGSVFVTGEYNPFTNIFKTVKYKGPTPPVVLGDSIMRYNGPGNPNDFVSAMEIDDFGNIYVAGTSLFNSSSSNFVTVKYNSFGDSLWVNKFRGPANLKDECKDLAIDNSGNVYVTGTTDLSSNELASATIKYNSAGAQQWAQIFQLPGYERNHSHEIISDDLGNTYVFGYSVSFGGNYSSVITKYNTLGIEQWRKIDNGEANEGLLFDNSGNIVHYVNLSYGSSYGIRKINSDGGVVWSNSMHLQGYNDGLNAKSICNDANDNFYIASQLILDYAEGRNSDLIVSKFDSNGDTLWSSRYGKFNNKRDDPTSITADNQGNVFITGYSEAMNHQRSSFFLKLNPDGDSVWVKNSMQPALYANSFIDFYGNVYTTGKTNDCVTIKYDQNGDSLWVKRYNGTGNSSDGGNLIKLSNSGTVYVSGYSMGSNGANSDIVTLKYKQDGFLPAVLNLTALIEGFYDNSSGKMAVDTAIVYLRNESAPYSITDSSKSVIDTNGNGTFTFQNAAGGNPYYIILKHRNSIETWSSSVQTFTSNSLSYNFTTAANKAYGDNLIQKGGKYCIYSGDVNNDGYIDLTDVISINNDVVNFVSGYKQSDLNGDSVVDLTDIVTDYNNTVKFVKVIRP